MGKPCERSNWPRLIRRASRSKSPARVAAVEERSWSARKMMWMIGEPGTSCSASSSTISGSFCDEEEEEALRPFFFEGFEGEDSFEDAGRRSSSTGEAAAEST